MGLMDKVKAQATQFAQKTQEAAQEGKARFDQAQANRRGDALLRQLGALMFAERTGRGTPDSRARIDQLVGALSAHEQQNGLNLAPATVPPPGSPADEADPDPGAASGQEASSRAGGGPADPHQEAPGGSQPAQETSFTPGEDAETGPNDARLA